MLHATTSFNLGYPFFSCWLYRCETVVILTFFQASLVPSRLSAKGPQSQETESKQRDLLPMPLPAFGALLNPVKELKRSGSGVILWDPDEARRICKQQRESSAWGKLVPASDHIETRSQRAALAGLSRRCAWWDCSGFAGTAGKFHSRILFVPGKLTIRHYTGDTVLKALPLRLEELAPAGLPEDGVAGSLDALATADVDVGDWLRDPSHVLLKP